MNGAMRRISPRHAPILLVTIAALVAALVAASSRAPAAAEEKPAAAQAHAPAPTPSPAPRKLAFGDPAVHAGVFRPFTSGWIEYDVRPDGSRVEKGRMSEELKVVTVDGRELLEDVQRTLTGPNKGDDMTFQLDRKTLAPVLMTSHDASAGTAARLDYAPTEVRVRCAGESCPTALRTPGGGEVTKSIPLETPVYNFFHGPWGTILAAMPLSAGSRLSLPVFHAGRGTLWMTFEVGEQEEVPFEGRTIKAWRITSPMAKFVLHVAPEAPYWVHYEGPSGDGGTSIYERG
jgi:hypothetical protein